MLCGAQEFVLQFVGTVSTVQPARQPNFLWIQPLDPIRVVKQSITRRNDHSVPVRIRRNSCGDTSRILLFEL